MVYSTLPLTTADIALLYDDFALGRSIVPPHAACVRPALVRWDPRAPLSLENCVVAEMKEVERMMWDVFAVHGAGALCELVPRQDMDDYVDALGDPIYRDTFAPKDFIIKSPEEVWGVEATRIAQSRIAQARRFREWALE